MRRRTANLITFFEQNDCLINVKLKRSHHTLGTTSWLAFHMCLDSVSSSVWLPVLLLSLGASFI